MESKIKKIFKKLISLSIIVGIVMMNAIPSFANVNINELVQGSPITSSTWSKTDEETDSQYFYDDIKAMSLYMSSCVIPFIDDYRSAFYTGYGGSEGSAANRLNFREDKTGLIKNFEDRVINIQSTSPDDEQSMIPLVKEGGSKATLKDLINFIGNNSVKEVLLKDSINDTVVFDTKNEFCKQVFELILTCISANYNSSKFNDYGESMQDCPLYKDSLGNIVCYIEQAQATKMANDFKNVAYKNIIIVPAAINPYLFSDDGTTLNVMMSSLYNSVKGVGTSLFWTRGGNDNRYQNDINYLIKPSTDFETSQKIFMLIQGKAYKFWGGKDYIFIKTKPSNIIYKYYDIETQNGTPLLFTFVDDHCGDGGGSFEFSFLKKDDVETLTEIGTQNKYNQTIYLNYLCMVKANAMGDGIKLGTKGETLVKIRDEFFSIDGWDTVASILENVEQHSVEDMINTTVGWIYTIGTAPLKFVNWLMTLFNGLFVDVYERTSDFKNEEEGFHASTMGFTTVDDLPILPQLYKLLADNIDVCIILLIIFTVGFALFSKATAHSPIQVILKVIICCIIFIYYPTLFNAMSTKFNELVSNFYQTNQADWILNYNRKWENDVRRTTNLNEYYDKNALHYVQDKSPIIINNTSNEIINALQTSAVGSLFVGRLLQQAISGSSISSNIGELNRRLMMLNYMYKEDGGEEISRSNSSHTAFDNAFASKINSSVNYKTVGGLTSIRNANPNYKAKTSNEAFRSCTDKGKVPVIRYPMEITQTDGTKKKVLVPYNTAATLDNDLDLDETAKTLKFHRNFYLLDSPNNLKEQYKTYFSSEVSSSDTKPKITKFNYKDDSKYNTDYGYFIGLENIIPYFYTVWWDTFATSDNVDIAHLIQGEVKYTDNTYTTPKTIKVKEKRITGDREAEIIVRDSVLVKDSAIIDYLDLEELFTNVVPYYYTMADKAKTEFGGEYIDSDWEIYGENKKDWVFTGNWAVKLYNVYNGIMSSNTTWCPAAMPNGASNEAQMLINEFYQNLTPYVEDLVLYINNNEKNVTKHTLIRYLALMSAIQFNKTFSASGAPQYPNHIDIGSVGIDTLWNELLQIKGLEPNLTLSAGYNLSQKRHGLEVFALTLASFIMCFLLPVIKTGCLVAFCIAVIGTLIYNATKTEPWLNYVKTMFGIFIGFAKLLVIYNIPTLILIALVTSDLVKNNNTTSIAVYLGLMAFASIVTLKFGISTMLIHFGFKNGKFDLKNWSWEQFADAGGGATIEGLTNSIKSVGGLFKKGYAATIGASVAGAAIAGKALTPVAAKAGTAVKNAAIDFDAKHDVEGSMYRKVKDQAERLGRGTAKIGKAIGKVGSAVSDYAKYGSAQANSALKAAQNSVNQVKNVYSNVTNKLGG